MKANYSFPDCHDLQNIEGIQIGFFQSSNDRHFEKPPFQDQKQELHQTMILCFGGEYKIYCLDIFPFCFCFLKREKFIKT